MMEIPIASIKMGISGTRIIRIMMRSVAVWEMTVQAFALCAHMSSCWIRKYPTTGVPNAGRLKRFTLSTSADTSAPNAMRE